MDYTFEKHALYRWTPVGYVAPVLVVKKGNPKKLTSFDDLAKPGIEVILPNPEFSTCGEMVFALMEKKKIKDAVLKNTKSQTKSHSETGNQMKLGYADAAIMWNGVANEFQDAVDIVPCPYEYDTEIKVGVIGLSYSKRLEEVEKFLKFAEAHGPAVFEEFGYVK
jgi:molybdate transport system substrate-binding protein